MSIHIYIYMHRSTCVCMCEDSTVHKWSRLSSLMHDSTLVRLIRLGAPSNSSMGKTTMMFCLSFSRGAP